MPRHVRTRDSDGGSLDPGGAPRRQWLTKWKTWAVSRLPGDAQRAVKVQLRVDVEDNVVEEATARLTTERDKGDHEARKKTVVALASVYLGVALNKSDRVAV